MVTKKQKKNLGIIGIVVIIIVVMLAISGNLKLPLAIGEVGCVGGQVLSIDEVNIRFSNELNKQVIRVRFSTVPTSECLDIRITPSQLEDKLEESGITDFDARETIIGDINLKKKDIEFTISETSFNLYRKFLLNNQGNQLVCSSGDCPGAFASLRDGDRFFGPPCICASDNNQGVDAEFSSGSSLKWETEVIIGGDTLTLNNGKLSGKLGDIAFVKWSGNLAGNIGFSKPDRDAYKPFATNQFRMVNSQTFEFLNTEYSTLRRNAIASDKFGLSSEDELDDMRAYNSRFVSKTSDGIDDWVSREPTVESAEIISNKLIVNLKSPIIYPTFILDIIAEEVGVFITTGKPDVRCPSNFEIVSGQTSNQNFQIKNVGQGSGSFSYSVDCNKGSQILSPVSPQSINKGNTLNIQGTLGLTVEEGKDTASCTFEAIELNTLEEDSCTFSYESTKQTQCIEGMKSCEIGNTQLWTCKADGSYIKETCEFGCTKIGTDFVCTSEDDSLLNNCKSNNAYALNKLFGGVFSSLKCKGTILQILAFPITVIKLVLVPIVLLFATLFGFNFFQQPGKLKQLKIKNKGLAFLVSLILGGILAYVVFLTFWIGLIIFVVYIIFSSLIKLGGVKSIPRQVRRFTG